MQKIISLLLCAVLILAGIAGCGRETTPETTEPVETTLPTETTVQTVPETEPVFETVPQERKYQDLELNYWSMLAETDPEAQVIIQAAEVFEKKTGAQICIHWQEEEMAQALTGGEADIFEVSGGTLGGDYLQYALDLTRMAAEASYDAHSFGCLRQQMTQQCGYLAGIPFRPYLTGIYYNTDLFAQIGIDGVPETWEAFLEACQKLRDSGNQALALNSEDGALALELHLERCLGAAALTELLRRGAMSEQEQALQQIVDFVNGGNLARGTPAGYPGGQNKMGLSNAAMTVGTNEICGQVEEAALADISWGVFPWPGSGAGSGTFVSADVLAVHQASAHPQAAFDFIMLLAAGEFDQLRADIAGGIPADPDNESVIAGAVEAMLTATGESDGLLDETRSELCLDLWNGGSRSVKAFVDSWGVG